MQSKKTSEPVLRGASQHNLLTFALSKMDNTLSKALLNNFLFVFWKSKTFLPGKLNTNIPTYLPAKLKKKILDSLCRNKCLDKKILGPS